jgi:hypothetical protein
MQAAGQTGSPSRRVVSAAFGTALSGVAAWLTVHNAMRDQLDSWIFWVPMALWLLAMALLCWWAVLGSGEATTRARIRAAWRSGWALGAVGLISGFFGPLVIRPDANLGPLLGIMVTGPLGFVLGVFGGVIARGTRYTSQ